LFLLVLVVSRAYMPQTHARARGYHSNAESNSQSDFDNEFRFKVDLFQFTVHSGSFS
jgi:hypothetical protein